MNSLSVRPADEDLEQLVLTYGDQLYKLCFSILGNRADAEDAVSDVVVKYMTKAPVFREAEHREPAVCREPAAHRESAVYREQAVYPGPELLEAARPEGSREWEPAQDSRPDSGAVRERLHRPAFI